SRKPKSAKNSISATTPSTSTRFSGGSSGKLEPYKTDWSVRDSTQGKIGAAAVRQLYPPQLTWQVLPKAIRGLPDESLLPYTGNPGTDRITVPHGTTRVSTAVASDDRSSTQLKPLRDGSRRPAPALRQELAPVWW